MIRPLDTLIVHARAHTRAHTASAHTVLKGIVLFRFVLVRLGSGCVWCCGYRFELFGLSIPDSTSGHLRRPYTCTHRHPRARAPHPHTYAHGHTRARMHIHTRAHTHAYAPSSRRRPRRRRRCRRGLSSDRARDDVGRSSSGGRWPLARWIILGLTLASRTVMCFL